MFLSLLISLKQHIGWQFITQNCKIITQKKSFPHKRDHSTKVIIKYISSAYNVKKLFYRWLQMQRVSGRRVVIYLHCEFFRNFLGEIFIKKYLKLLSCRLIVWNWVLCPTLSHFAPWCHTWSLLKSRCVMRLKTSFKNIQNYKVGQNGRCFKIILIKKKLPKIIICNKFYFALK